MSVLSAAWLSSQQCPAQSGSAKVLGPQPGAVLSWQPKVRVAQHDVRSFPKVTARRYAGGVLWMPPAGEAGPTAGEGCPLADHGPLR